jgi:hypothetical protein
MLAFIGTGPLALLIPGSYDRPIGVGMAGIGGVAPAPVLPRRAVVITREIVETALHKLAQTTAVPPMVVPGWGPNPPTVLPGVPPGTLAIPLLEPPLEDLQGRYVLYLQVERIP